MPVAKPRQDKEFQRLPGGRSINERLARRRLVVRARRRNGLPRRGRNCRAVFSRRWSPPVRAILMENYWLLANLADNANGSLGFRTYADKQGANGDCLMALL